MIIDKVPIPEDPTPIDAPPSYEGSETWESYNLKSSESAPVASTSTSTSPQPSTSAGASYTARSRAPWNIFANKRTARELRRTVLGLIRELVQHRSPATADGILASCRAACAAHDISLSALLQQKSIEGHTPLYWAIVKPHTHDEGINPDILFSLLAFCTPLAPETVSEIRTACIVTSDQLLFQRLRLNPAFAPPSGTDAMLLGGKMPHDTVTVENVPNDESAFAATLRSCSSSVACTSRAPSPSTLWQKVRLHTAICANPEPDLTLLVARMFRIAFTVSAAHSRGGASPRPGSWFIALSLLENSSPTWIDSCLLIPQAPTSSDLLIDAPLTGPLVNTPSPSSTPVPAQSKNPFLAAFQPTTRTASPADGTPKPRPTICLRFKSSRPLAPSPSSPPPSPDDHDHDDGFRICVPLDDSLMGPSLQYGGSPYIAADGALHARFEARLVKPEADCVIC
ncbi:hypothetical protein BD779DRAFT_1674608 [Infundibulicybe gibba]|nr:hypothetical protein BD779DRAFT_1674608 [Infundibulicybe gibba]